MDCGIAIGAEFADAIVVTLSVVAESFRPIAERRTMATVRIAVALSVLSARVAASIVLAGPVGIERLSFHVGLRSVRSGIRLRLKRVLLLLISRTLRRRSEAIR